MEFQAEVPWAAASQAPSSNRLRLLRPTRVALFSPRPSRRAEGGATRARIRTCPPQTGTGSVQIPQGQGLSRPLLRVVTFALHRGKIANVEIIGDRARLRELDLGVIENS